jgi:Predicted nucleic acid-binding protein, contains PIN domain
MVLLDSDHMSLLQRGGAAGNRIKERLGNLPAEEVATTIISYEEQMRGWLARLAKANTLERQISDYRELKILLRKYCSIPVVDFGTEAATRFENLKQGQIRVGSMDLKIAAIALANEATLLTRNLIDFGRSRGLKVEDWSI